MNRRKSVDSRSRLTNSTSKTSVNRRGSQPKAQLGEKTSAIKIQITGDDGKDVTPKALFTGVPHDKASQIQLEENSSASDFRSMASIFQTGLGTQAGISLFGQSILGSGQSRSAFKSMQSQVMNSQMSSMADSEVSDKPSTASVTKGAKTAEAGCRTEELTPQDLEKDVTIVLDETDTITTFRVFPQIVQEETENIELIREQNDEYIELCAAREGNDKFVPREMQTFNNKLKDKQTSTIPLNKTSTASQSSRSILWDAYNLPEDHNVTEEESGEDLALGATLTSSVDKSGSGFGKSTQSSKALIERTQDADQNATEILHNAILNSDELQKAMVLVERIISQNNYQRKIALYRGLDQLDEYGHPIKDEEEEDEMRLNRLWSFQSPVTKSFNVTAISWNKANPDIIAVAYGQIKRNKLTGKNDSGGLVCCWNIKNLEHPERVYHTKSSALSVSFSQMAPNLLAVGLYNGVILIYNVARSEDLIAIDSYDSSGKHSGPCWQLEWVERERGNDERGEVLISIAHDGRVIQWTIRKGFESLDLMKIKRSVNSKSSKKTEQARISAYAPTVSFDFHPTDGNTYLVGTEEGAIHRCSCSYNEQTLDVYKGHGGPVYCVKWHPTIDNVFASCSEDWTIRIWTQKETKHVIKLDNGTKPIRHIQWSKYSQNLLLAITESSIHIWDLTASILDPIMKMPYHPGCELNKIQMSPSSNCLLVGDSDGIISVYQILGFNSKPPEEVLDLIDATLNSHE